MIQRQSDLGRSGVRPLRVMFMATSMPIGGAETLLMNLVRTMDRRRCQPEITCLKEPGELGEEIAAEIPVHSHFISHKYDFAVVSRLRRLFADRRTDALVTVGAGDKMFWGRLAARYARLPVVLSALHSTGWPDGVGRLNRMLTGITDGFIAVASSHAQFLIEQERFPAEKVFLIPNGIDTDRFSFSISERERVRRELGIEGQTPVVGIVAALRPEKNHELFLHVAREILGRLPTSQFLIVGDGPQRAKLEQFAVELGIAKSVRFLGSRGDIPAILSAMDLFALSSQNEASPVSILEAMACSRPVVAPDVGSIGESVREGITGSLVAGHDVAAHAQAWLSILGNLPLARAMGQAARAHVLQHGSLVSMTRGYEDLVWNIYQSKRRIESPAENRKSMRPPSPSHSN